MSLRADILTIMSSPQWNFLYHFIVLLVLEAMLGMAYGHWRRTRQQEARRLVIGCAVLLGMRLVPLVFALLPITGISAHTIWLPPLERALDTISLAVIAWSFVFFAAPQPYHSIAAPMVWTNVGLIALAYAALTRLWAMDVTATPTSLYTMSWQRYVWAGWQMLLCLAGAYVAMQRRHEGHQSGTWLSIFGIVFVGQLLEVMVPIAEGHAPAWERLGNLLIYPLLAWVMYRIALEGASAMKTELLALPVESKATTDLLLDLFQEAHPYIEDVKGKGEIDHQTLFAYQAAGMMARALGADQTAIGLLEGDQEDRMRLIAVFNPQRQGRGGEVVSFPLDEQLAIRRALRRQEMVLVSGADDIVQLKFLYALMGSGETGPLLIQPLLYQGHAVGAFIAGNSVTKRPFSSASIQLAPLLADLLAQLLFAPKAIRQLEQELREKSRLLAAREAEWDMRLETLDHDLQQERQSAQLFAQRLADLEREVEQKRAEIEQLTRKLLLQEEESRRSRQEAAALSKKLETLVRAKVSLEDQIKGYQEQIHGLELLLSKGEKQP